MTWRPVGGDIPEGKPILIAYPDLVVVALAYPGDDYCPEMTFMDARTFEILPIPPYWMELPEPPPL